MMISINSLLHLRLRRIKEGKKRESEERGGEGTENYDKMDVSNKNIMDKYPYT